MKIPSYGKIERQTEAYGEWLRRWRHREMPEENAIWAEHQAHARLGDKFRDACNKARGSQDRGLCTCPSLPGFQAWATEERRLAEKANSRTYPRLEAIRRDMDEYREDLKRKAVIMGRALANTNSRQIAMPFKV